MNAPGSAREALIVEAIGDLARLIDQAHRLEAAMDESRRALVSAHAQLADQLASFETQVMALAEKAKVQAVSHILARTDEAARRSIALQGQAMADAARVALGVELGATLRSLEVLRQPPACARRAHASWLAHAASAAAASAVTWLLAGSLWAR